MTFALGFRSAPQGRGVPVAQKGNIESGDASFLSRLRDYMVIVFLLVICPVRTGISASHLCCGIISRVRGLDGSRRDECGPVYPRHCGTKRVRDEGVFLIVTVRDVVTTILY